MVFFGNIVVNGRIKSQQRWSDHNIVQGHFDMPKAGTFAVVPGLEA